MSRALRSNHDPDASALPDVQTPVVFRLLPVGVKRALNKKLARWGERWCEDCAARFPLDLAHFYKHGKGFAYVCIPCHNLRSAAYHRARKKDNPAMQERYRQSSAASQKRHRDTHNARQLRYMRRKAFRQVVRKPS